MFLHSATLVLKIDVNALSLQLQKMLQLFLAILFLIYDNRF